MIELRLPTPPSANNLYANGSRGRFKTPAYEKWLTEAGWEIQIQRPGKIAGPVSLEYAVEEDGRRDLGNFEKPLSDCLVRYGVIEGDRNKIVRAIVLRWSGSVRGVHCYIERATDGASMDAALHC